MYPLGDYSSKDICSSNQERAFLPCEVSAGVERYEYLLARGVVLVQVTGKESSNTGIRKING